MRTGRDGGGGVGRVRVHSWSIPCVHASSLDAYLKTIIQNQQLHSLCLFVSVYYYFDHSSHSGAPMLIFFVWYHSESWLENINVWDICLFWKSRNSLRPNTAQKISFGEISFSWVKTSTEIRVEDWLVARFRTHDDRAEAAQPMPQSLTRTTKATRTAIPPFLRI